jgi:hypothetical protein
VEDLEIASVNIPVTTPSFDPWPFTFQPAPFYSGITVTCEASHAEG